MDAPERIYMRAASKYQVMMAPRDGSVEYIRADLAVAADHLEISRLKVKLAACEGVLEAFRRAYTNACELIRADAD